MPNLEAGITIFDVSDGATGATGATGPAGATGAAGRDAEWYYGTALTATSGTQTTTIPGATVGSMYLNTETNAMYKCTSVSGQNSTWTYVGNISENSLIFEVPYTVEGDNVNMTAKVFRSGQDVTSQFRPIFFEWLKRTETGDEPIGTGYTKTVTKSSMGYGGSVICRFRPLEDSALLMPNNKHIIMPDGKRLTVYA